MQFNATDDIETMSKRKTRPASTRECYNDTFVYCTSFLYVQVYTSSIRELHLGNLH